MRDVVIVGAGPAGLFAAYELVKKGSSDGILILEKGLTPAEREEERARRAAGKKSRNHVNNHSNTLSGVGGAGLFSDGKLNFTPVLGKTDLTQFMSFQEAQGLVDYTEEVFSEFGMDSEVYPSDKEKARQYSEEAKKNGINLMLIRQKHIGSDVLPKKISDFAKFLVDEGVEIKTGEDVKEILADSGRVSGVRTETDTYEARSVIVAPGRVGSKWLYEAALGLGINVLYTGVEVGVRVEVPFEVMDEITRVIYDPTFFIRTKTHDDMVRTFCTNRNGYVSKEKYEGFVCVNGHAYKEKKSKNSNFAFLSKVELTDPMTDTFKYGKSIGKLATTIGDGKPIIQRYSDLNRGSRSTWSRIDKSYIEPTLKDVTPGDISMAMPGRIVLNLVEGLEKLNQTLPGVSADDTLLYAPEIKFFSTQIETNNGLETRVKGLLVAGDGAGVAGNIVGAAASGVIAARSIVNSS